MANIGGRQAILTHQRKRAFDEPSDVVAFTGSAATVPARQRERAAEILTVHRSKKSE
jgi:hypothetical protein